MSVSVQHKTEEEPTRADESPELGETAPEVYDRSSLKGDFMVMIADQSEEDFFRLAPESRICEFIDGTVYMPSPVANRHQQVTLFLSHLLDAYRSEKQMGPILPGPAVLKLRQGIFFEPDLFVLPVGGEAQMHDNYSEGPAQLVIEVLSKSTRRHDLERKMRLYRSENTAEIWMIDQKNKVLFVERKVGEGYRSDEYEKGSCRCASIPGFWIESSWLWSNPLPNPRRCLETIFAGPPA